MENNKINIQDVLERINESRARSAYSKGVKIQAIEMLEELTENGYPSEYASIEELTKALLNGADDFNQWAFGGCGLIYNTDIAARFCGPKELERTQNGLRDPNRYSTWIDVYAQAVNQAYMLIIENC